MYVVWDGDINDRDVFIRIIRFFWPSNMHIGLIMTRGPHVYDVKLATRSDVLNKHIVIMIVQCFKMDDSLPKWEENSAAG